MAEQHPDALEVAVRALRARDQTAASLDARLERRGVAQRERTAAIGRLRELGYVDDARFAHDRARALASRGAGDLLIVDHLERHGVPAALAVEAISALESEAVRAGAIVERRGAGAKTARFLAAKGFGDDVVEALVAVRSDEGLG